MKIISIDQFRYAGCWLWLLFGAFSILFANTPFAQSDAVRAELPSIKVEDRWRYERNDGRTGAKLSELDRRVTSVSPSRIEGTESNGKFVWTPELSVIESSVAVLSKESKDFNFSLEVGKKWGYKYTFENKLNSVKGRWQLDAEVVASERVKVLAGEFDAFKIEYNGFWNNYTTTRNGRLKITRWYAPITRSLLKTEFDDGGKKWVL